MPNLCSRLVFFQVPLRYVGLMRAVVDQHPVPRLILRRSRSRDLLVPIIRAHEARIHVIYDAPIVESTMVDHLPNGKTRARHVKKTTKRPMAPASAEDQRSRLSVMLRLGTLVVITVVLASAQVQPSGRASTGVSSSPTNVSRSPIGPIRPAAPGRPNIISPSRTGTTPPNIVAPGLPRSTAAGVRPAGAASPAPRHASRDRRSHRGRTRVFVPVYYPVFGYDGGYGQAPNVIEVNSQQAARSSAQSVVVVGGGARQVSVRPEPEDSQEQEVGEVEDDYVLIALAGGLIYAAESYELDFAMLTFTTIQGERYVVSRAEVDVEFTKRLNAERGVEIELR